MPAIECVRASMAELNTAFGWCSSSFSCLPKPPLSVTEKSIGVYNAIEKRRKRFLFLLGNTGAKRKERHPFISILKIQPLFARFMLMSTALAGTSVFLAICGSTALIDRVFSGCFLIVACYTIFGSSYSVIVRVRVVLKRTVVGDWRFDNLSGGHFASQVKYKWIIYDLYFIENCYLGPVLTILLVQCFHTIKKKPFNTKCRQYRETFAKFMTL